MNLKPFHFGPLDAALNSLTESETIVTLHVWVALAQDGKYDESERQFYRDLVAILDSRLDGRTDTVGHWPLVAWPETLAEIERHRKWFRAIASEHYGRGENARYLFYAQISNCLAIRARDVRRFLKQLPLENGARRPTCAWHRDAEPKSVTIQFPLDDDNFPDAA